MRILAALSGLALLSATGGAPARADVLEIDAQGGVHVRGAAGAVQWVSADGETDAGEDAGDWKVPDAAVTTVGAPVVPEAFRAALLATAERYGVSADLLAALVRQESGWRAGARSAKGAFGLAQLMPATARSLAVDARDPLANLAGGALYLRRMLDLFDGDVERALAAYNAGPGRVARAGGVPAIAETQAYVSSILLRLAPAPAGGTGL